MDSRYQPANFSAFHGNRSILNLLMLTYFFYTCTSRNLQRELLSPTGLELRKTSMVHFYLGVGQKHLKSRPSPRPHLANLGARDSFQSPLNSSAGCSFQELQLSKSIAWQVITHPHFSQQVSHNIKCRYSCSWCERGCTITVLKTCRAG